MASSIPTATISRKKNEREKKEEELRLRRLREKQILKKIGIIKPHPYAKPFKASERSRIIEASERSRIASERSRIIEEQRFEHLHPPQTDQSIIELLAQPIPGSALNPVTDMSLIKLTVLKLNSGICLPVLDL